MSKDQGAPLGDRCVPYRRKGLYWLITLPMLVMYGGILIYVGMAGILPALLYLGLMGGTALGQSYICACWDCPYVGRFAPCVGGFCLPASRLAGLWTHAPHSESRYQVVLNLTMAMFGGALLFPGYFLYRAGFFWMIGYVGAVFLYLAVFLFLVCPACATNQVCPAGQLAVRLRKPS